MRVLSDLGAPFSLSVARVLHTPPPLVVVFRWCIGSSSNCYSSTFLLSLTSAQDDVVVIVSYSWSRSTKCSTPLSIAAFSRKIIVYLLDYVRIAFERPPHVRLGWSQVFDLSCSFFILFFIFYAAFVYFGKIVENFHPIISCIL